MGGLLFAVSWRTQGKRQLRCVALYALLLLRCGHPGESPNTPLHGDGSATATAGASMGGAGAQLEAPEGCEFIYAEGHGDLFVTAELGLQLRSAFLPGQPETLVEPERVCVVVPRASHDLSRSLGGTPNTDSFSFLGLAAGQPFWLLPQTPRAGMPWFGVSSEAVPKGLFFGDTLLLELEPVAMPQAGGVALWSTDTFGTPSVMFSTATGQTQHRLSVASHLHLNWAFTAPGGYSLRFRVSGQRGQTSVEAAPAVLRFSVQQ